MQEAIRAIAAAWDLTLPEGISEQALLGLLADRIGAIRMRQPEYFYQLMYRLDISESRLADALQEPEPDLAIARLIWERQWQKARSRRDRSHPADDTDRDLQW